MRNNTNKEQCEDNLGGVGVGKVVPVADRAEEMF
jgi:hypothetical protein